MFYAKFVTHDEPNGGGYLNILVCNQEWFKEELQALGHTVVTCGMRSIHDVQLPHPMLSLEWVLNRCPEGFEPDRILILDESGPIFITGIEESGIPTLFYSVDCHHHAALHCYAAVNFSQTLIAQKDYTAAFEELGVSPQWFPLWASRYFEPSEEKEHDATFVGTLDATLNPERVTFFEELQKISPIYCTMGAFWEIFPKSKIVVNQTVKGDLNFRVFEAMMSGAVLLTEESENGLSDIFIPDTHLVTYKKGNVEEAAAKINHLLANADVCAAIGAAGRQEVLAKHCAEHRAKAIADILTTLRPLDKPVQYFPMLINIEWMYRKVKMIDSEVAHRALLYSQQVIAKAVANKEVLDDKLSVCAIFLSIEWNLVTQTNSGYQTICDLSEVYPDLRILKFARIWMLLNQGKTEEAQKYALELPVRDTRATFREINTVMSNLVGIV